MARSSPEDRSSSSGSDPFYKTRYLYQEPAVAAETLPVYCYAKAATERPQAELALLWDSPIRMEHFPFEEGGQRDQ